jgi:hypothetical protein
MEMSGQLHAPAALLPGSGVDILEKDTKRRNKRKNEQRGINKKQQEKTKQMSRKTRAPKT